MGQRILCSRLNILYYFSFLCSLYFLTVLFFLKDLNKDLSQKLEAQTQRLELLTAQRMANENVLSRPTDSHSIQDTTEYTDEGDEVGY